MSKLNQSRNRLPGSHPVVHQHTVNLKIGNVAVDEHMGLFLLCQNLNGLVVLPDAYKGNPVNSFVLKQAKVVNLLFEIVIRVAKNHAVSGIEAAILHSPSNLGKEGIGVIGQDHEAIEILAKQKQPHVLIDRYIPDFEIDCVLVDNRVGARKAVARLIELGHRRIGFISGRRNLVPSMEREQGYREALRHLGINVDPANLVEGDFGLESGNRAALRLLSRPHRPTALFAANDMMAIGALKAARQMALRVPEDLSVIGFDDIQLSSFVSPSLTTVAQPKYTMGRRTAEILLTRIKQPETKTISENLSTRVVERESHGMAPKETAA